MLQQPQFTLSILDPTSLLGAEVAGVLYQAFPLARRRFFHTTADEEHLVAEVGGGAAMVPPLVDTGELDGSDVVVATSTPTAAARAGLVAWLRAHAAVVLIDCTQPGVAPAESAAVLDAPPPGRSEQRWFHLVDPSLWAPARMLQALAPLRPLEAHLTMFLPASGFGEAGVEELAKQAASRLSGRPPRHPEVLPGILAFDLRPETTERREALTSQLCALFPDLRFQLHAIDTGVFHGNAAVVAVACGEPPVAAEATALLRRAPGMRPARRNEPVQPSAVVGTEEVVCADIRCDGHWVTAWVVADGLRVGGARAVAEILAIVRAS